MKKELIPIIEEWHLHCPKCGKTQIVDFGEDTGYCTICNEVIYAKDELKKQHPKTYELYFGSNQN